MLPVIHIALTKQNPEAQLPILPSPLQAPPEAICIIVSLYSIISGVVHTVAGLAARAVPTRARTVIKMKRMVRECPKQR